MKKNVPTTKSGRTKSTIVLIEFPNCTDSIYMRDYGAQNSDFCLETNRTLYSSLMSAAKSEGSASSARRRLRSSIGSGSSVSSSVTSDSRPPLPPLPAPTSPAVVTINTNTGGNEVTNEVTTETATAVVNSQSNTKDTTVSPNLLGMIGSIAAAVLGAMAVEGDFEPINFRGSRQLRDKGFSQGQQDFNNDVIREQKARQRNPINRIPFVGTPNIPDPLPLSNREPAPLPNLDQEAKPKYKSSRAKGYQAQQTQYTRRNPGHLPNDLERPSSSGNVGENGNGLQQLVGTLVFVLLQSVPRLRVFRRAPKNKEKEEQKPKEEK